MVQVETLAMKLVGVPTVRCHVFMVRQKNAIDVHDSLDEQFVPGDGILAPSEV